jgi:hypothetical protein
VDIGAFEVQAPNLSPAALPDGTYGSAYTSQPLAVTEAPGGAGGPYTFAVTARALPAGLSLDGTAGTLSGTPTATGVFTFTVTATDSAGFTGSQRYTLTIDKAALTITAKSTNKTYGQAVTFAGTDFTASGLVNGDTVSGVTLNSSGYAASATVTSPGPTYTITPSAPVFSAGSAGNYSISYDTGTLTVTPATLTILPTAGQSMVAGSSVPVLHYNASGFVNSDGPSLLTGLLGTTATSSSPIGNYPFTLNTLSAGGNYTLSLAASSPTFAVTSPTVVNTQIDDGTAQRSMVRSLTLTFGSDIAAALASVMNSLSLTRTDGLVVGLVPTLDSTGTKLTLTFTGSSIIGGSLADGRYNLVYNGNPLLQAGTPGQTGAGILYRLFGDLNQDAKVTAADKTAFLHALNSRRGQSNYSAYLDYDENGLIVINDLAAFNLRYGTSI